MGAWRWSRRMGLGTRRREARGGATTLALLLRRRSSLLASAVVRWAVDAVGGNVEHPFMGPHRGAHKCLGRIVVMQKLQAWIESRKRGDDGKGQVAAELGAFADPIAEAQHADAAA